ncbi:Bardet-Biedl syndrome 4 protein isoform X2 [Zootermopsis nevadensis]|nr:Bardet-Biedl syndrome 4 protein isoform X2 [Zootermopsis nevadensis]XP_021914609.1 Bardet-Biedl syndrome 4 protein isoform X2 [Zootermopsis nevadensis]
MCEYANYVQGLILRHEGKIQESLEYFQTCHTLNPRNVNNIKEVARSLYLLGRHGLAIEAYLEAENVSNKPDWDIYHNLGTCLVHVNEHRKAKEYLLTAIQLSHQEASYVELAKIHLLENDIEGAIGIYNAALEWYPDSSKLATSLGLLYMTTGHHQRAFEKLGSALAHDPMCTKALLAAGFVMQNYQDFDIALSKYKIAAQFLPESISLWNNIGMCFFEKKKYVAAISCLKRANYLSPLDWKTLYNLGLVHLTTKQYASAFHYLSAAINLQPTSAKTYMLLALALKNLDDPDNAHHAFEQAAKLDPNDAAVALNYGVLLNSVGEREKASAQLRQFQELAERGSGLDQELLEAAQNLSLSLTKVNKNYLETDANEKCKEDETNDADKVKNDGEGSVDTHEMDPDEV